ncbi:MAG TPA: MBL fold metallo-hydrolase [Verrucomicrobiae bacterium]|nr:MBL fold metallo-hydrolase [Verrucomicrobiae bacterium]
MRALRWIGIGTFGLAIVGAAVLAWKLHARPGLAEYTAHRYALTSPRAGALTATWFGTTAVLLRDGEHAIFIDPYFTRAPGLLNMLRNAKISPDEDTIRRWLASGGGPSHTQVAKLDAVLVSHSHFDHGMDAGVVAQLTGAMLVGSASTANIGRGARLPEERLKVVVPDVPLQFGSFRVTFVEGVHAGASGGRPTGDITEPLTPPARYADYKLGGAYSILVEHPEGRVLHHGSAGFIEGKLAGRRADVVLLGVALLPDLETYLSEVVDAVGARRVIPTHWDDFTRSLDEPLRPAPMLVDLEAFFREMPKARPGIAVQTLELGVPAALFP